MRGDKMRDTFDLVSIGEPLVGLYPVANDPELGRVIYGGDASNVALAAARLGLNVAFAGGIGDDLYGQGFSQLWRERGVDTSLIVPDPARFTGMYVISFTGCEHRFAYYRKGSAASEYHPTRTMLDAICSAKVVHVSGISQAISVHMTDMLFEILAEAQSRGALISYDLNYRPNLWGAERAGAVAERTIRKFADIFSTNSEEFVTLGLAASADELFDKYGPFVELIAVRDGDSGATIFSKRQIAHSAAFKVNVADTVGAGDAFDGGLIAAHLHGYEGSECVDYANAVAALTCRETGSTKAHPTPTEVADLLKSGMRLD